MFLINLNLKTIIRSPEVIPGDIKFGLIWIIFKFVVNFIIHQIFAFSKDGRIFLQFKKGPRTDHLIQK